MASALVNSDVRAELIDQHYWRELIARADRQSAPSARPYSDLEAFCRQREFDQNEVQTRLQSALQDATGHADTHPALKDRLAAIGHETAEFQTLDKSAAEHWLGENYARVVKEFDEFWLERNEQPWRERYDYVRTSQMRLSDLRKKDRGSLDANELWELATLTEEFDQDADPLPVYKAYQDKHPEDLDAALVIGRILLSRDDESGIPYLEEATNSLWLAVSACQLAYGFYLGKGNTEKAEHWQHRGEHFLDQENEARQERDTVEASDTFLKAELGEQLAESLCSQLANYPRIKRAWVARKHVEHLPESPVFALTFKTSWLCNGEAMAEKLANEIQFPGLIFFAYLGGSTAALGKKIRKHGTQLL